MNAVKNINELEASDQLSKLAANLRHFNQESLSSSSLQDEATIRDLQWERYNFCGLFLKSASSLRREAAAEKSPYRGRKDSKEIRREAVNWLTQAAKELKPSKNLATLHEDFNEAGFHISARQVLSYSSGESAPQDENFLAVIDGMIDYARHTSKNIFEELISKHDNDPSPRR